MSENEQTGKTTTPFWLRVFWDCCWVWAIVGIVVATARLIAHDSHLVWVLANCQSTYLYGLAALVLPLAIWQARRKLACVSAILMLAQIVWVWPDFFPAHHIPISAETPILRIFSANLYMDNKSPAGIVDEIEATDAEIVLLQEFSPRWNKALNDQGLMEKYPYTVLHSRNDSFGIAVLSKHPFLKEETWYEGEVPLVSFQINWQSTPINIHNWHPLPPRSFEYYEVWNQQYEALLERLTKEGGPSLVIGDFNATQHTLWMKRLLKQGYQSAHNQTGRGYAVTYPNGTSRVPPMRLDHALMSKHFACQRIQEGVGQGSDHKPLIIDIVLLDSASSESPQ